MSGKIEKLDADKIPTIEELRPEIEIMKLKINEVINRVNDLLEEKDDE